MNNNMYNPFQRISIINTSKIKKLVSNFQHSAYAITRIMLHDAFHYLHSSPFLYVCDIIA